MKNDYLSHLKTSEGNTDVQELPGKKQCRALLLGKQLDKQVRDHIWYLRAQGCIINDHIFSWKGHYNGYKDSSLLDCNDSTLVLTKDGANNILNRMGMVKQQTNTKLKVSMENLDEIKKLLLLYRYKKQCFDG